MSVRICLLLLSTLLCLTLAALPAAAGNITLYSNGPAHPNDPNAWNIDFLQTMSSSFYLGAASTVTGFSIGTWVIHYPGGEPGPYSVDFSITSAPDSGTIFDLGTAHLTDTLMWNTTASFCGSLPNGSCDVFNSVASLSPVSLVAGTYYLNLTGATTPQGDPTWWDENDGIGCTGWNGTGSPCPATAYQNGVLLPGVSLDPDIYGSINGTTPEPGSFVLFGSGLLGLAGIVRRKLSA